MKEKLMFYDAYQEFYKIANNEVFKEYCKKAFGEDFSQDGFSDVHQINKILRMVNLDDTSCILDIGCGNGKMLEYIHENTRANIYGFDYSENAIKSAKERMGSRGDFQVAVMGEIDYPENKFDLITSMDTIYFASDMVVLVSEIYKWLKPNGSFICGYQEGDIMEKTKDYDTTVLAEALRENGIKYTVIDYTDETYEMLKHKRKVIISMKDDFKKAGINKWYKVVRRQTDCVLVSLNKYKNKNARYIYIVKKIIEQQ